MLTTNRREGIVLNQTNNDIEHMKQTKRNCSLIFKSVVLSALISNLPLSSILISPSVVCDVKSSAVWAATGKFSSDAKSMLDIGLDKQTFKLVNLGEWQLATNRLVTLTSTETEPTRLDAWLAFAYMYQGECPKCQTLADKVSTYKSTKDNQVITQVVQSFNLICQGNFNDANNLLTKLVEKNQDDILVNFALAAVASKRGQTHEAVRYCHRTVELEPDFAWGYRTAAFIEDRLLKDTAAAKADYEKALAIEPKSASTRNLLVDLLVLQNDFDGAVEIANVGIKSNPHDATNYYRLAQIYMQQWRLKEAFAQLQKAISRDPNEAKYHHMAAIIFQHQGDFVKAISEQKIAIDLSQDKSFELVRLASLNVLAGDTKAAANNLQEALKADSNNAVARQRLVHLLTQEKKFDELANVLKQEIEHKPNDPALHLELARVLKQSGKIDEAIAAFKQAANLDPKNPAPHREVAEILVERQEYNAAAKEYTYVLNINPTSVDDLSALGHCYANGQDYLQAEAAFVTAIAMQQLGGVQPNSKVNQLDLMRALATLLLKEGRYADAASQLEAICASSKTAAKDPYDQYLLAEAKALRDRTVSSAKDLMAAYEKLSDTQKMDQKYAVMDSLLTAGQVDLAVNAIAKLTSTNKNDIQLLVLNSRIQQLKNNLASALDFARQATNIQGAPNHKYTAQIQLARVFLTKGNAQEAEDAVKKAIDLDPKSYLAYEIYGKVFLAKGDKQQALAYEQHALEINPYCANSYMLIGDINAAINKWKEAAVSYKKATELYPGWLNAHKALLNAYKKQALKNETHQEEEQINQIEKRK